MNIAEAESMLLKWARINDRLHEEGRILMKSSKEVLKDMPLQFTKVIPHPINGLYLAFSSIGFEFHVEEKVFRATTLVGVVELAAPEIGERLEVAEKRLRQIQAAIDVLHRG